jgi:predicted ATPase
VAASLPTGIRYHELNLAKSTEPEFRTALARLDSGDASLCLVDEVDAKPQEPWPYEALLPYLDAAVERGARFVFVLAGSSGASIHEIKQRIATRPKGTDLLSRIPTGHEYEIGPMSLGDRILIVLSQLRQAGREMGREIRAVEKLGLYYVALNERLANARQLREFAVRAVERVPKTDSRVKYDHLFVPGDPENKAFWVQASPVAERLINTFVLLTEDPAISRRSAPPRAPARPRTNLPHHLASFIGRDREIAEVARLLPAARLMTLTGFAGVGKTRLALRVAADLVPHYPNGVWVAELGALSDPALVPKAVATALDVPEQPGRALAETLKTYLRTKTLLLILDNCEHLVSACAELADGLLRTCPTLRILATSREPLGIFGETVWRVPVLSSPTSTSPLSVEEVTKYDAVRLFVDRAALSHPGFRVTGDNVAAVTQVAHRLEGIPLAIELAAARIKALPVDVIVAKLDDRFRLLTHGGRTALRHQQTLRATLDWSFDLLPEPERILLRRLSVFAGGFTMDAAEDVCVRNDAGDVDILDRLTSLVEKSLVVLDAAPAPGRYRLLETVRQYGAEKLQDAGEVGDVRRRHRDWFLALAEQAEPELRGPNQRIWFDRLETEHDNLRAAFEWTMTEVGGREEGLRLATALGTFWRGHGHWSEPYAWLEAGLTSSDDVAPSTHAKALAAAAGLAWRVGQDERAIALAEEGLALSREVGDRVQGVVCLFWLSNVAMQQGDYERAKRFGAESLSLGSELDSRFVTSLALQALGEVARYQGDYDQAIAFHEQSLAMARDAGDPSWTANVLRHLSMDNLRRGDYGPAAEHYKQSLYLCKEVGNRWVPVECLNGLGDVASVAQQYERAARLFGAAHQLRDALGLRFHPSDQECHDRYAASTRARLGESAFAVAWAEGRAMTLEQAIEYGLAPEGQIDQKVPHSGK